MSSHRTMAKLVDVIFNYWPQQYPEAATRGFEAFKLVTDGFVDYLNADATAASRPGNFKYLCNDAIESLRQEVLHETAKVARSVAARDAYRKHEKAKLEYDKAETAFAQATELLVVTQREKEKAIAAVQEVCMA